MAATKLSKQFVKELEAIATPSAVDEVARFFRSEPNSRSTGNKILGVRFGSIFSIARQFIDMPLDQVESLLASRYYEVRMGAVSILDFKARNKKITAEQRKALFDVYLKRHDRIDNWDMVDRAAPSVVGGYLVDKARDILHELARSPNPWERRTAIVSTYYFIRQGDVDETFKIAELLVDDPHDLVQKAVGSWLREAGKRDQARLLQFLNENAPSMPRAMLRYAVEKLSPAAKAKYL